MGVTATAFAEYTKHIAVTIDFSNAPNPKMLENLMRDKKRKNN